jgi:hypothetical protein
LARGPDLSAERENATPSRDHVHPEGTPSESARWRSTKAKRRAPSPGSPRFAFWGRCVARWRAGAQLTRRTTPSAPR